MCSATEGSVREVDSYTCHDCWNASLRYVSEKCDVGSLIPIEGIFINSISCNSIVNPACDKATKIYQFCIRFVWRVFNWLKITQKNSWRLSALAT